MDVFQSISEAWDRGVNAVPDGLSEYLDINLDRAEESITSSLDQKRADYSAVPVYQTPTSVTADQYKTGSAINWTKWGVIFGGVGVALTAYKLLKG